MTQNTSNHSVRIRTGRHPLYDFYSLPRGFWKRTSIPELYPKYIFQLRCMLHECTTSRQGCSISRAVMVGQPLASALGLMMLLLGTWTTSIYIVAACSSPAACVNPDGCRGDRRHDQGVRRESSRREQRRTSVCRRVDQLRHTVSRAC